MGSENIVRAPSRVLSDGYWMNDPRAPHPLITGRYRWVRECDRRTKESHPYSYDEHFLFGDQATVGRATDAVYSDRIWQWDRAKAERCWGEHIGKLRWDHASEVQISAFLSAFFDKPVEIVGLAEGCNHGNGYPYWVAWFRDVAPEVSSASPSNAQGDGS